MPNYQTASSLFLFLKSSACGTGLILCKLGEEMKQDNVDWNQTSCRLGKERDCLPSNVSTVLPIVLFSQLQGSRYCLQSHKQTVIWILSFVHNFYSLSRKTVNTRENFWNVYCFATNQMRDETATDACQTARVKSRLTRKTMSWLFLPWQIFVYRYQTLHMFFFYFSLCVRK